MHISSAIGASALLAGLVLTFTPRDGAAGPPAGPAEPPAAAGHYALVVQGDRDQLTITHASHKPDPWSGVRKGLTSDWRLSIRDGAGAELANVPLDLSKFDLSPAAKGRPRRVEGCIVHDTEVVMLANVPCFAAAASYVFLRGADPVGTVDGAAVRALAGGGR